MANTFLTEDVAGLDIADTYVAATRIGSTPNGGLELRNAGWVIHEPGLPDTVLASAIRSLWRRCGMPTSTVCSAMHNPSIAFRYFKHGNVSPSELEAALWLQGEELLHKSRGEIAMDWLLNRSACGCTPPDGEVANEGILVAVPAKDVDRHLAILEMAGLFPVILDVGCLALSNIFLELCRESVAKGPLCLINLSDHFADMAIVCDADWIYPHAIVFNATRPEDSIAYLCDSINNVLRFHQYKLHRSPVTRIVIAGKLPIPSQLQAALQKGAGLPVEIWNPLQKMTVRPAGLARRLAANPDIGPLLATSLGLALRRD